MTVKANELQPGQVIRVEYGDYGNWQQFSVEKVQVLENKVVADVCSCSYSSIKMALVFRPNEEVEVVV